MQNMHSSQNEHQAVGRRGASSPEERRGKVDKSHGRLRGFTIVELLVVIVVIAILAAITIVAYNGIQDRAHTAKTVSTVDTYTKVVDLYKAEHGAYPNPVSWTTTACLGATADYPAADGFADGQCAYWSGGSHSVDSDLNSQLTGYTSSIPSGSTNVVSDGDQHYRGVIYQTGCATWDETWTTCEQSYAHIHYFLAGHQACPTGTSFVQDQITECIVSIDPPEGEDLSTYAGRHGGEG